MLKPMILGWASKHNGFSKIVAFLIRELLEHKNGIRTRQMTTHFPEPFCNIHIVMCIV